MQSVSFTAAQYTAFLLLVCAREVKATQVSACIDLSAGYTDILCATADGLKDRLVRVNVCMLLINITDLHGFAHTKRTLIGFLTADNHPEEGCLTRSVGTNHTHNAVRRQHEIEVLK